MSKASGESAHKVTIRYSDGAERVLHVSAGETVLDAAEASGVPVVSECQSGICGTCVGSCVSGEYDLGRTEGLSEQEREVGKLLTCQTHVRSDCVIALEYPVDANAACLIVGEAVVESIENVSDTTAILRLDVSGFPEKLQFRPGQFAQLQVPGTMQWRNYSYANSPGEDVLEFIIRLLPSGTMSDYLRTRASVGDRIQLRGSKGHFHLREVVRPLVLIAGGTGLSAILAIAAQLADEGVTQPVRIYNGVTRFEDLCKSEVLQALCARMPNLSCETIVTHPDPRWSGPTGVVTDLLAADEMFGGDVDFYLCGPPAMVESTRRWLVDAGLHRAGLYYEKFLPTGGGTAARAPMQLDAGTLDYAAIERQGKGTAVVIGGSIVGISAAKALTARFDKVIVLEKDSGHHRMEGRPGAAQGWHLHHLLIAGQRKLESIFPGIIDDMVREGAFKVDMAEQYRLYIAGSWKKACKSGVEIVCAGRPLLEWCVRRRLDDERSVEFRYDSEAQDLVYSSDSNRVLGVGVAVDGELKIVPAELVVDASGKNTRVPEILGRLGIGTPEVEKDSINCFYATMRHVVPPERRWKDKVMIICYAYRPNQEHYTAQYYIDSSRRTLSTSLVGYNCYSPPRNAAEFQEFAKLMPNQEVARNIEGLEPASPVYNFRYPDMMRLKYERMPRLPAGLVALGDAYASADPVSGLGMTIGLLELGELQTLLAADAPSSEDFVRRYYRKISKIADLAWFVVREQNLRYPWIRDVEKKRPFYFRLLTWYMDRLVELCHDDMATYRKFLEVVHLASPPASLMTPRVAARVLGKWLYTKMRLRKTLIERNFGGGGNGDYSSHAPGAEGAADPHTTASVPVEARSA